MEKNDIRGEASRAPRNLIQVPIYAFYSSHVRNSKNSFNPAADASFNFHAGALLARSNERCAEIKVTNSPKNRIIAVEINDASHCTEGTGRQGMILEERCALHSFFRRAKLHLREEKHRYGRGELDLYRVDVEVKSKRLADRYATRIPAGIRCSFDFRPLRDAQAKHY